MKLLLALLLSCLPFNGSNGGKELLDKALERCETPGDTGKLPGYTLPVRSVRQDSAHLSPERQVQEE